MSEASECPICHDTDPDCSYEPDSHETKLLTCKPGLKECACYYYLIENEGDECIYIEKSAYSALKDKYEELQAENGLLRQYYEGIADGKGIQNVLATVKSVNAINHELEAEIERLKNKVCQMEADALDAGDELTKLKAELATLRAEFIKSQEANMDLLHQLAALKTSDIFAERDRLMAELAEFKQGPNWREDEVLKITEERDRYKAALQKIVWTNDFQACDEYQLTDIAREALKS